MRSCIISKPKSVIRPELTKTIDPIVFKDFYWEKKELVSFCKENGLPYSGGKLELEQNIDLFLRTGSINKSSEPIKRQGKRDSEAAINRNTIVINYKNDAKTKQFFIDNIGSHFHFNAYLRQFSKTTNLDTTLTYGDLINGWIQWEENKKSLEHKMPIEKQFQFNQFQRDFYLHEKNKTRAEMLEAWKLVRSVPGKASYTHYLAIIKEK